MSTCLQSTSKLSETVAHLGIKDFWHRSQTVSVGLRCGQEWWSGFRLGRKNTVKPRLTPGSGKPRPVATCTRLRRLWVDRLDPWSAPGLYARASSSASVLGDEAHVPWEYNAAPGELLYCADSQPRVRYGSDEARERLVVKADAPANSRTIAGSAVRPSVAAIARSEMQPTLVGLAGPVDKRADEAGVQASIDKASLRPQAPHHLAGHGGEVLQVGVKEHAYHNGHGLIPNRQQAGVCSRYRAEPAPGEAELVSRDVKSRWPVTCVRDRLCTQASAAGQIDAGLPAASAKCLAQEGQFFAGRRKPEKVWSYHSECPS
jgi:hypothetical protein